MRIGLSPDLIPDCIEPGDSEGYHRTHHHDKEPRRERFLFRHNGRIQNFDDKLSETITHDNNPLILTIYAGWKISDPSAFYPKFVGSVPRAQETLEGMLRNAKQAVVSTNTLSDFVNPDPSQLRFDQMEQQMQDAVQAQLTTNNYGIQLVFLGFKKIELPQSVTQSVFDRMKGERQVIISSEQNQGLKEATIIKSTADRTATETIANANATATRIMGEAQAKASQVLPIFEKDPALANYLLRLDALQQALNHLLSNAVKFTEAGGTVAVGAAMAQDGGLVLFVRDSGIGIPEEDLERVFEPFTQLDGSLARRFQGAGLGLYISRALVAGHGGTLALRSMPGEGTVAEIHVPANRVISAGH